MFSDLSYPVGSSYKTLVCQDSLICQEHEGYGKGGESAAKLYLKACARGSFAEDIAIYCIYNIPSDEKEDIESTEPVKPIESTESTQSTTIQPFQAIHRHSIDIRQYPQINSSPLYAYDSIISMCWAPGKPYLVTGLKYQGLMVWSVDGEMLYAYNSISSNTITSQEMNLSQTVEVSCCCFSLDSTRLLFSIPYDEIHQDNQENVITILSHLCYQQFMVTTDIIHSLFLFFSFSYV